MMGTFLILIVLLIYLALFGIICYYEGYDKGYETGRSDEQEINRESN